MYTGWFSFGGTEIINAERVEAYVAHQIPELEMRPSQLGSNADLHRAVGDAPYESPLVDDAPWVDRSTPDTLGFYGVYPLDVSGLNDSTRRSDVVEAIVNGGSAGAPRHSSREIRFRALLVARDQAALEEGMTWLSAALNPPGCGVGNGVDLCYFKARPELPTNAVDWSRPFVQETPFGPVSASTSPLIHRFPFSDGPAKAEWHLSAVDGVVAVWGALATGSDRVLEQSNHALLQRTNYITDPLFTAEGGEWQIGGAALERMPATEEEHSYGRVVESAPPIVRVNWAPDPGMRGTPALAGWTSNGRYGEQGVEFVAVDDSPSGSGMAAQIEQDPEEGPLWAEFGLVGPIPATMTTVSFWVSANPGGIGLTLLDSEGVPTASADLAAGTLAAPWNRVSITGPAGPGSRVQVQTAGGLGQVLQITGPQAEEGEAFSRYFDGSFPSTPPAINILPNPTGALSNGTVTTPYGEAARVTGFTAGERATAWRSTERALQGSHSVAVEWSPEGPQYSLATMTTPTLATSQYLLTSPDVS